MQTFNIVSNQEMLVPDFNKHGIQLVQERVLPGCKQSNYDDCGCHCIKALREMAAWGVEGGPGDVLDCQWNRFRLKTVDAEFAEGRDDLLRRQIALECISQGLGVLP